MNIRRACNNDLEGINNLLCQVLMVHHNIRPDLFKANTKKYTDEELMEIIADEEKPIFVALDENNQVLGYAFCVYIYEDSNVLVKHKSLYIDDLCVDESRRGQHVGSALYDYVIDYARNNGFFNVTLNVWEGNDSARAFYDSKGFKPYKTGMEVIL